MSKPKKTQKHASSGAGTSVSKGSSPVLLQVLPELNTGGGVERGAIDIAKAAKDAGYISLVASQGGTLVRELDRLEIRHIQLPLARKNVFTMVRNIWRLEKIIRENGVNIVHARSRAPAWSAYVACKRTGAHFVTTFHGTYGLKGMFKKWYNAIMLSGEKVIAISEFIKEHIVQNYEVDQGKIMVIHRGVDMDYFDPAKVKPEDLSQIDKLWKPHKDFPVILLPARLTRWKGQDFVLRSLARLKTREYTCIFMGRKKKRSHYIEELVQLKTDNNLRGNISFAEPIDDMRAAYRRADIVISAATQPEAFGRVAAEAQAMGCTVIATNIGGSKEVVLDRETGHLVEPGNEEGMAELIETALGMSVGDRARVARKARAHIEKNFSLKQMTEKTLKVYKELLA